jgi:hypothetical protein
MHAAQFQIDCALLAESGSGQVFGSTGWAPYSASVLLPELRETLQANLREKK